MSEEITIKRGRGRPIGSKGKAAKQSVLIVKADKTIPDSFSNQIDQIDSQIRKLEKEIATKKDNLASLEAQKKEVIREKELQDKHIYESFLYQIKSRGENLESALEKLKEIASGEKDGVEY